VEPKEHIDEAASQEGQGESQVITMAQNNCNLEHFSDTDREIFSFLPFPHGNPAAGKLASTQGEFRPAFGDCSSRLALYGLRLFVMQPALEE
jgi:hypothetical protein